MADVWMNEKELVAAEEEGPVGDEKDILEYKAVKEREQGTQNSGKSVLELTASKLGGVGATDAADTKQDDELPR